MTTEEKTKAYDEMVQRVKELHETGNFLTKKQMEIICPELAESEDERIRKFLIDMVKRETGFTGFPSQGQVLAYLEKQKDSNDMAFHEGYTHGFEDGMKEKKQKEPHYTKRNTLFDKCVENCDPEVMKRVSDEIDEMLEKEQKPDEIDGKALLHVSNKSYDIGFRDGVASVKPVEGEFPYNTPADTVEGEIENIWSKLSCENKFTATKTGFREVILHFVNYVRSNVTPDWSEEDEKIMQTMIKEGDLKPSEIAWLKSLPERFNLRPKVEWSEEDEK